MISRVACSFVIAVILSTAAPSAKPAAPEPKCQDTARRQAVQVALKQLPDLVPSCRLDPAMIEGDFNGDGKPDYAVVVTQQTTHERGFLFVFADGRTAVAGAGRLVKYGAGSYPDLNFDYWELYQKSRPVESAEDQKPLKLRGDALLVSYHESARGLFYWDGGKVRWYQQGD